MMLATVLKRSRFTYLALLFLLPLLAVGNALAVDRLYSTRVEVADQGPEARQQAFREALSRTVIKLSGDRSAAQHPAVEQAARRAERLVQRFDYAEERAVEGGLQRILNVHFDRQALNRLLLDADIAFWGRERPDVLVWLAMETEGQRRMVGQSDRQDVTDFILTAEERGLHVFLPLLDLEEQRRVPEAELWGGYTDGVAEMAFRYGVETFLVGRLTQQATGSYSARWELHDHHHSEVWRDGPAMALDSLLKEGAHQLSDRLGARYSVRGTPADSAPQRVVVHGVNTSQDYARALRHLRQLSMVDAVSLVSAVEDRLEVNVSMAIGEGSRLVDAVRFGQVLQPIGGREGAGALEFRMMP